MTIEFCTKITKSISQVIGRDKEIESIVITLLQKQKNNVMLVGQPGVGKSAIVEQLSYELSQHMHTLLSGYSIYALDLPGLLGDTGTRGKFESRLSKLLDEVENRGNVILFIDEIHNIIGTGSLGGSLDAANMLKEKLARGTIKCIGATTESEYYKYIKQDNAFERRFGTVYIKEPSSEATLTILKFLRTSYSDYHSVEIDDNMLESIIRLCDEYMPNHYFPDKAITILDYACAHAKLQRGKKIYKEHVQSFVIEKRNLLFKKENAAHIKKTIIQRQIDKLDKYIKDIYNEKKALPLFLTDVNILKSIENRANMKIYTSNNISKLEKKQWNSIYPEQFLQMRQHILDKIITNEKPILFNLNIDNPHQFKIDLNNWLFHDNHPCIEFNMELFHSRESIHNFIGSSPGFTGYTEFVSPFRTLTFTPSCIILFENFEAAHPSIQYWIEKIIKDGQFIDNKNNKYILKHTIILFTSQHSKTINNKNIVHINF